MRSELAGAVPPPYLRPTSSIPPPLHVRISLAKSEYALELVRRWY